MKNCKPIAALLALLCCLPFAACTANRTQDTAGSPDSKTESETKEALPVEDFEGYALRIFMRHDNLFLPTMAAEEITGDPVNDAVYKRNDAVCSAYNATLDIYSTPTDYNGNQHLYKTIAAGEDAHDLLITHARALLQYFAGNNLLLDWNKDVPYVDLAQSCWDQNAVENLSLFGRVYAMTGDLLYSCLGNTDAMLVNKDLFADCGFSIDELYTKVLAGKWTFDDLQVYAQAAGDDLDGDGNRKLGKDRFGYMTQPWFGPMMVLFSGGGHIGMFDKDGVPYLSLYTEHNLNVYEQYFSFLHSDTAIQDTDYGHYLSEKNAFVDGNVLFCDIVLDMLIYFRGMQNNYGIIPFPKFEESLPQYYSLVNAGTDLVGIPVTNPDVRRTGLLLEALAEASPDTITPAYYEQALQRKFVRDDVSAQLLDILRESRIYDVGYYYEDIGGKFSSIGYLLATEKNLTFSSFYVENIHSVTENMEKFLSNLRYAQGADEQYIQ